MLPGKLVDFHSRRKVPKENGSVFCRGHESIVPDQSESVDGGQMFIENECLLAVGNVPGSDTFIMTGREKHLGVWRENSARNALRVPLGTCQQRRQFWQRILGTSWSRKQQTYCENR